MSRKLPPRVRAALIHLAICAFIAAMVFLAIYLYWYPGALFGAAGGRDLFVLIVSVDVTLGPLITLIIFNPAKKELVFDLAVIAVIQLAALAYGVWVLYESRPAYIAFVKDRYELVRANGFPEGELEKAPKEYQALSITGPRLVGVRLPKDPVERERLLSASLQGVDAQYFPRYYAPYDAVRDQVKAAAMPISKLRTLNPGKGAQVDRAIESAGRAEADLRYLPLRAGKQDVAVLLDAKTGDVLGYAALDPWGS
jgi:hypothetical protein